jgi:hypothetical protein
MKKSELKAFIKEEIKASLSEGVWSVMPERIPEFIQAVKDLMDEYHAVVGSDDVFDGLDRAIQGAKDLMAMRNEATIETSPEDLAKVKSVAKPDDVIKVTEASSDEDEEEDEVSIDKKAIAAANKAKGKTKKLDLAFKALKDITTEMKALARDYSAAKSEVEKEKIKDILKKKTPIKKELEAMVNKLADAVV